MKRILDNDLFSDLPIMLYNFLFCCKIKLLGCKQQSTITKPYLDEDHGDQNGKYLDIRFPSIELHVLIK